MEQTTRDLTRKTLRKLRISSCLDWKTKQFLLQYYYRIKFATRTFEFRGHIYNYFYHRHNTTWKNERTVEVPIVWNIVKNCRGRILEIGNVLSHYFSVTHDIVDKYEKAKDVINQDIINFRPLKSYDLIVSISTLEHIGWDEKPREPKKMLCALESLKSNCLASNGKMVITAPLGYNPELDRLLNEDRINLGKQYYLKRVSMNEWVEASWNDVRHARCHVPFPFANGIVVSYYMNQR